MSPKIVFRNSYGFSDAEMLHTNAPETLHVQFEGNEVFFSFVVRPFEAPPDAVRPGRQFLEILPGQDVAVGDHQCTHLGEALRKHGLRGGFFWRFVTEGLKDGASVYLDWQPETDTLLIDIRRIGN